MISTLVVLGIIAAIVFWGISIYNGLVAMRQRVSQAFADIDVQLKQRHDLIPNLIETVKGYVTHERETLDAVVKARNAAIAAQGPAAQGQAESMLSGALRQLFALSEAYPDLKASANFQQLQTELADIENKIAARAGSSTTRCRNTIRASRVSRPCWSLVRSASINANSSISAMRGRSSNRLRKSSSEAVEF